MTRQQAQRIVNRFMSYHEAYVNRGGGNPNDIEIKELQFKLEKEKLVQSLVKAVDIRVGG